MAFQILSLSGGGFLGLYTISVLAELEAQCGRPLARCFDLLAGTSVGGIIALGLANEKPAAEIKAAFEENGTRIFSDRAAPTSTLGRRLDLLRSALKPKYDGVALRETIERVVGADTLMGDLKHPVIVPTVNLTKGAPQLFKTAHHPDFKRDHRIRVTDVAMATSAAPTYFPIAQIGDELFADGGLYANSPDFMAIHEAEYFFSVPLTELRVLSIGTSTTQFSMSHVNGRSLGIVAWSQRLAQTMISAQQMDVAYMAKHKLADRYLRIDSVLSKDQEQDLGLDIATNNAQQTIRGVAAGAVQAHLNAPLLRDILAHDVPSPCFFYGSQANTEEK
ncbi:MAG TPA: CBASS cGAMP-activated phospholipase [Dongiaceae bacterium]|jgi:patatin-like phospholipase/acyl hydrolase|nr:CBASS cGAMP-activated phospholipase [Dongiaceae bacterium]